MLHRQEHTMLSINLRIIINGASPSMHRTEPWRRAKQHEGERSKWQISITAHLISKGPEC
eukprot:1157408-Pelagomonas_calceolata.AAC.14